MMIWVLGGKPLVGLDFVIFLPGNQKNVDTTGAKAKGTFSSA